MSPWEPGELLLVPRDADVGPSSSSELDELSHVEEVQIYDGEKFVEDDPGKYEGPQRRRLLMGVAPSLREAKLRYYFESLGDVLLP